MIYLHRRYNNDYVPEYIVNGHRLRDDGVSIALTNKKPVIKWHLNEPGAKVNLTSLMEIRKYFEYVEPDYQSYMNTWLNIHPNQYRAAREVVDYYQHGIKNVILTAEMQSGKTGVARYVTHSLLHLSGPDSQWDETFTLDSIYFICGMNDNDLRSQAIREFEGLIKPENILFSKQLQKYKTIQTNNVSLVIVDESHYAGNVNSLVDKFLESIRYKDPYILSVSATAMAELATSKQSGKAIVYLHPGEGYYSIRDIFARNLIFQSVNITREQQKFIDLVVDEYEYQRGNCDLKYNIVRLPNQWYYKDLEDDIGELDVDIAFLNHHSTSACANAANFNDYLKDKPPKMTIIWIYGSLRAGKQLDTTHIGFVHDTYSSAPDTIAQSLLGRILGYGKRKNYVKCYTDLTSAKLMLEWMTEIYNITKIPIGSKGVIGGHSDKIKRWKLHPPLAVFMDLDARSYFRSLKQKHGNRYSYKHELYQALMDQASQDIYNQVEDILTLYEPGRCGGLMIMTENNTRRSFSEHWCHNYICYLQRKPVRGFDAFFPGKYYYVFVNLDITSTEYGCALITYKEYIDNVEQGSDHVLVKDKSRFSIRALRDEIKF